MTTFTAAHLAEYLTSFPLDQKREYPRIALRDPEKIVDEGSISTLSYQFLVLYARLCGATHVPWTKGSFKEKFLEIGASFNKSVPPNSPGPAFIFVASAAHRVNNAVFLDFKALVRDVANAPNDSPDAPLEAGVSAWLQRQLNEAAEARHRAEAREAEKERQRRAEEAQRRIEEEAQREADRREREEKERKAREDQARLEAEERERKLKLERERFEAEQRERAEGERRRQEEEQKREKEEKKKEEERKRKAEEEEKRRKEEEERKKEEEKKREKEEKERKEKEREEETRRKEEEREKKKEDALKKREERIRKFRKEEDDRELAWLTEREYRSPKAIQRFKEDKAKREKEFLFRLALEDQGFEDSDDMATTGSCLNSVEAYTGDTDVEDFLDQIDAVAQLAGWADHQKCQVCRVKLKGVARQFLKSDPELEVLNKWEELHKRLVERFSNIETLPSLQHAFTTATQKRGETAAAFGSRLQVLAHKLNKAKGEPKDEDERVLRRRLLTDEVKARFLQGIAENIRRFVRVRTTKDSTLEQCIQWAMEEEIMNQESGPSNSVAVLRTQSSAQGAAPRRAGSPNRSLPRRDLECFGCGGKGHLRRECPSRLSNLPSGGVPARTQRGNSPAPVAQRRCSCQCHETRDSRHAAQASERGAGNSRRPWRPYRGGFRGRR